MSKYFDEEKDLEKYILVAQKHNKACISDNMLGCGMYGVCFKVSSDKALKITGDDFEVSLAINSLGCDLGSMPSVHKVTPTDEHSLWIIEMDLCQPLEKSEIKELEPIFDLFHEYAEHGDGDTLSDFRCFLEEEDCDHALLGEIDELIELASEELGFNELDFHLDNLMRCNGDLVLIDQKKTKQSTLDIKRVNAVLDHYRKGKHPANKKDFPEENSVFTL